MTTQPLRTANPLNPAVRSPKQSTLAPWYPYYAGYSKGFVDDILARLQLGRNSLVVDPWNGSGITTTRAAVSGYRAIGIDANPVLVLVARGRALSRSLLGSIDDIALDILDGSLGEIRDTTSDPLRAWFRAATSDSLRSIEAAIQRLLVDGAAYCPILQRGVGSTVTSLAAFMYVCLFRTARHLLRARTTTNPTWFRLPRSESDKVECDLDTIRQLFLRESMLSQRYLESNAMNDKCSARILVQIGNAETSTFAPTRFDALLGSPPYCTRIDYAVATSPELAILGYAQTDLDNLRRSLTGSPTVSGPYSNKSAGLGPTACDVLNAIAQHPSKASDTYYHRYYSRYFASLHKSLTNIAKQARRNAKMCLVVQDTHYKEIHVALHRIVLEQAESTGWELRDALEFPVSHTKAAMNPAARRNRRKFRSTEYALVFHRQRLGGTSKCR